MPDLTSAVRHRWQTPGMTADSLLLGLDPEQRAVAEAVTGPVVVLAGAGTGKTRAITHRIAYGVATGRHNPKKSLAVTFTTRAAGEMTRRLAGLGVEGVRVRTFHSAAIRQLKWAWPQAIGGEMYEVISSKSGLIASAASASGVSTEPAVIRDLATEIEWAKAVEVAPDGYVQGASSSARMAPAGLDLERVAKVYAGYERAKRDAGRIDFEDVLLLTAGVLEDRPDLRRQVCESFAHFTVDEFQDVSAIQQKLLDLWLAGRDEVCVVGDVSQTIYSFAGANPRFLTGFASKYPKATTIQLNRCYRCTPEVVEVAEQLIQKTPRVQLKSQNDHGPAVELETFADEVAEAQGIVSRIKALIAGGTAAREIAILVRINAQTEAFETALADAGIPYTVRGGRRFFERPEVRKGVVLLRGAAKAANVDLPDPGDTSEVARAVLSSAGWTSSPPQEAGAVREAWESLAGLVAVVDEVCLRNPSATLRDVVDELERRELAQDAPSLNGVTLASLHSAKGMEWDAVFIAGLVDGVVPMSYAITDEQLEEERRLLYVGVTRARTNLTLSWAKARNSGGRTRKPSRFLRAIGAFESTFEGASAPRRKRKSARTPATCRVCAKALVTGPERSLGRCRTCPSNLNEDLLAHLKEWRTERVATLSKGREKPMPAYVVATDATLLALAEQNPSSIEELAAIPGLGPVKLDQYGSDLLALLLTHG